MRILASHRNTDTGINDLLGFCHLKARTLDIIGEIALKERKQLIFLLVVVGRLHLRKMNGLQMIVQAFE